jgi:hypothetical protein
MQAGKLDSKVEYPANDSSTERVMPLLTHRPIALLLCGALLSLGLTSTASAAVKKQLKTYTKGTAEMAGGNGQFGQTYTVVSSDGFGPVNFTILSAQYSVEQASMSPSYTYAPKVAEKLLVIHYRMKNPNSTDMYYSSRSLFQAVDANNNLIDDCGYSRRESEKDSVAATMKPGQGIDDLFTFVVVPASGPIPKLILKLGPAGSNEFVTRYFLGKGVNIVKPIPAPYADPSDTTGATPLAQVPGVLGTVYHAGYFDISLTSVSLAPGPLGSLTADDGKQFVVASVTVTNKSLAPIYYSGSSILEPTLTTDDDTITQASDLAANHDDPFDARQVGSGESVSGRMVLEAPKDANLKTLSLAENVDNGNLSKAIVYDVSNVKSN